MKSRATDQGMAEGKVVSNEAQRRQRVVFENGEPDASDDVSGSSIAPDIASDITPAELREFLAADHLETRADPGFKERLRKKLWTFVKNRYGSGSSTSDS